MALHQVADFGFLVVDFLPDFCKRQDAFFPPGCCGVFADFQQPDDVAVVQPVLGLSASMDVQLLLNGIQSFENEVELVVGHVIAARSSAFVQAKVGGRKNGWQLYHLAQLPLNALIDCELG